MESKRQVFRVRCFKPDGTSFESWEDSAMIDTMFPDTVRARIDGEEVEGRISVKVERGEPQPYPSPLLLGSDRRRKVNGPILAILERAEWIALHLGPADLEQSVCEGLRTFDLENTSTTPDEQDYCTSVDVARQSSTCGVNAFFRRQEHYDLARDRLKALRAMAEKWRRGKKSKSPTTEPIVIGRVLHSAASFGFKKDDVEGKNIDRALDKKRFEADYPTVARFAYSKTAPGVIVMHALKVRVLGMKPTLLGHMKFMMPGFGARKATREQVRRYLDHS